MSFARHSIPRDSRLLGERAGGRSAGVSVTRKGRPDGAEFRATALCSIRFEGGQHVSWRHNTIRWFVMASAIVLSCATASSAQASDEDLAPERAGASTHAEVDTASDRVNGVRDRSASVSTGSLILNGGFSQQPNPLAFWTNAPGAFAIWASDGANASLGSVQLRFIPLTGSRMRPKGAVYYTGLTQCVSIPGPGSYVLGGYSRVPAVASPSSLAGVRWSLRTNGPQCSGPVHASGNARFPRSTTWTVSLPALIQVEASEWTASTTIEIEVQVGDSSTTSIEPVTADLDEIELTEAVLFGDGFE
jgi:hypothetical protein